MRHVARPVAWSAPVVLIVLPLLLGCASSESPSELSALLEESRAARRAAWDARRQATRAGVFAEAAEQDAAQAGSAAARAEELAEVLRPGPRVALEQPLRRADEVRLRKGDRRLELYREGELLRSFRVALGFAPDGQKHRQGDGRTPEGRYTLDGRYQTRRYGRALHLSYPRPEDVQRARAAGVEPGGGIFIHGLPNGLGMIGPAHREFDWTNGCIAVTNEELEEILARVADGTPIEILP